MLEINKSTIHVSEIVNYTTENFSKIRLTLEYIYVELKII